MATSKTLSSSSLSKVKTMSLDNVSVANAIRSVSSPDYQSRIPEATKQNIADVGNAIVSYTATMNEYLNALVNRIALTIIQSKMANNKLAKFKKGMLPYGKDVEEVYTNMARAQVYDPDVENPFGRVMPDVKAIFHRMNRQDKYKTTIYNDTLRSAFLNPGGMESLIADIVNSLYSGDQQDEFLLMKQLIVDYANKGNFYDVTVDPITDEASAKKFVKLFRQLSDRLTFMSDIYNASGVITRTEKSDQVFIVKSDIISEMDVEVLAWAFNNSNVDFTTQIVTVDNFNEDVNTMGALVDRNWFMVWDKLYQFSEIYNPESLYWNEYLHHWQILSTSLFANAIRFIAGTPATSLSIPGTLTVNTNSTNTLAVTFEPVGATNKIVQVHIDDKSKLAYVSQNDGTITLKGLADGTANVTVSQGNLTSEKCVVTVQTKA